MLTLLRASKHRPGGPWSDNDFNATDHEGNIGRIVLAAAEYTGDRDEPWFWSITCKSPSEAADWGSAASLEEAKQAFKARWLVVSANKRPRLP